MSIRNKLFLFISMAFIGTILLLVYIFLPHLEQHVFSRTTQVMEAETRQVAATMEGQLARRGAVLKAIALHMEYQDISVDNPNLSLYLAQMVSGYQRDFNYLYAGFGNKIHITTRTTKPPLGFDPTSRLWYQDAWHERGLVVTEPYNDIQTGRFSLSMAYPINLAIPGVLGTDLYIDDLSALAVQTAFHPKADVVLLSKTGNILYLTDSRLGSVGESFTTIQNSLFAPWAEHLNNGKSSSYRFTLQGEEYYTVFSPVALAGWTVAVYVPQSVLEAEQKQFVTYAVLAAFAGTCFVFLIVYFVIYRITGPLEAIAQTADKMGSGNLDVEFTGDGTREVESLALSLNLMRQEIRCLVEDKETLWEETAAQNEELSAMNEELGALYEQTKSLNECLEMTVRERDHAYVQTIMALTDAIEASDCYTRGHSERVFHYAKLIGIELNWNEEKLTQLQYAAILHDVGKIGIPSVILTKPGKLTDEEFLAIKAHPEMGWRILKNIEHLRPVGMAVWQHHERVDGRGYPQGLAGDDILLVARVLAIADAFDAMTSERTYRPCLTVEEACKEIRICAGKQFDSKIVEVFCTKVAPCLARG